MNTSDIFLLHDAFNNDTIKKDVLELINTMKKEKVTNIHTYTITPPKTSTGRWQTYICSENGRKKISSTTEKGLYNKLYDYYFKTEPMSLEKLYPTWLNKRKADNVNARTIQRNKNHWNKYYINHKIISMPLTKLTAEVIESFFHECIRKYSLTVKELNNMKFIMADILKMAKRKRYLLDNPFLEVEINTNACKPPKNMSDKSRVYLPNEKAKLFSALNDELKLYPENTDSYAIFLLFKLGLRIGEIVALKFNDVDYHNKEIHIHRMETLDIDCNNNMRPKVVDYTKKKSPYGNRFLPISDYEIQIIKSVEQVNIQYGYFDEDFIFCDSEGRTKIREIDNRIRKLCYKAEIPVKSAHDIRRTVASEMFNNNVPVEIIRNYLGHSDIKTTWGYILDNHTKEETAKIITKSLNNLCGLKRTQTR